MEIMWNAGWILIVTSISLILLLRPKLRGWDLWRATVTPLASIIGSGFLVCAPLLAVLVGNYATLTVALIGLIAYGVGSAVRFNMTSEGSSKKSHDRLYSALDALSAVSLGFSFVISVAFYIQLLAAFVLRWFDIVHDFYANIIATCILAAIGSFGFFRGLSFLEALEEYSVGIKLSIILGLIAGLSIYNSDAALTGTWHLSSLNTQMDFTTVRHLMGLLLIVQGFETSRYLKGHYSAEVCVRTMKAAQIISWGIYIVFVGLMTILFPKIHGTSETDIIPLAGEVSFILPSLIVVGALMSQFSAAVADTIGSAGLLRKVFGTRLATRYYYVIISSACIALVWLTNILEVISLASRSFAIYYALQTFEAICHSWEKGKIFSLRSILYIILFVGLIAIAILGLSAE